MVLGMKVGPQKQSLSDVSEVHPPFVEVWFDISRADEYKDLFAFLRKQGVAIALHFWGTLPDGTWANIAYPDQLIIRESMKLYRRCLDIAATVNGLYVNIHPGSRAAVRMDMKGETFTLASAPVPEERSAEVFLENALALHDYAAKLGILFTVETVPLCVYNHWSTIKDRSQAYSIYELTLDTLVRYHKTGGYIANDFGHTAAGILAKNPQTVRTHLRNYTRLLYPSTRLIHIGFIVPPYNGTDFHDQLDNPAFIRGNAVPDMALTRELLALFRDRDDVYALVEPSSDHPKNFRLAENLMKSK